MVSPTLPDIEIIKTQPVIISVINVRGLRFDQELMFDGKASIKLRLDPTVIKLKLRIKRLRLDLRFSVLQIALHLITCLMPIFFKGRLSGDWKISCVMHNLKLTKDSSTG